MDPFENITGGEELPVEPAEEAAPQFTDVPQEPIPDFEIELMGEPTFCQPEEAPVFPQPEETSDGFRPAAPLFEPAPETKAEKPAKKGRKVWKGVLAATLAVALVVGSSAATAFVLNSRFDQRISAFEEQIGQLEQRVNSGGNGTSISINTVTATPSDGSSNVVELDGSTLTPAQVYAKNLESVVLIYNEIPSTRYSTGGTATGSGFILTSDGYVVTNYHVVEGDGQLSVVTSDGTEYPATLVGYDNANDVALLKVEATGLQAVVVGDSDALVVGDQVAAIGNPLGELTSTLTVGVVSAKERDVNTSGFAINMIQTDAAINSGNSGGPLFNMRGEVVGITTAKYSGSTSSGATIEGIGFAIPINDVIDLLEDLLTNGKVTTPYLGVSVSDIDASTAYYYGFSEDTPSGAYVSEVVSGSCAETAGIRTEDIIVSLGGHTVSSVNTLSRALRNFEAGQTIEIVVYRNAQEVTLTITLDERPADMDSASTGSEETVPDATEESTEESSGDWFSGLFPGLG